MVRSSSRASTSSVPSWLPAARRWRSIGAGLAEGLGALRQATEWMLGGWRAIRTMSSPAPPPICACSVSSTGGWLLARSALAAHRLLGEGIG